jgi:hypothetical protein
MFFLDKTEAFGMLLALLGNTRRKGPNLMFNRKAILAILVAITANGNLEATDSPKSERQDFQVDSKIQEKAEFFSSRDRRLVFRLFTSLNVDSLRRQQDGQGDSAYSVDLVVGSDGAIQEFAINRFSESSVFQVDRESERLRFLRLRDAGSVFREMGIVSEALQTDSDFVFRYVTEGDDQEVSQFNRRVLRAIRVFDSGPSLAKKVQAEPKETVSENLASHEDATSSGLDRIQFLEELNQDVEIGKTSSPTQSADTGVPETNF